MHSRLTSPSWSHLLPRGLVCLVLIGCLASCGPQKSKEERYWEEYKESVAQHSLRWPGFSTLLNGMLQRAQPAWNKAAALTDKAKKNEKMKAINTAVNKVVRKLDEVAHKMEGAQAGIDALRAMTLDKAGNKRRQSAVVEARKTFETIEHALRASKPMSELAALTALEPIIAKLISLQADLKRTETALKDHLQ